MNRAKTQNQCSKFFRELGILFAMFKTLEDEKRRCDASNVRIQVADEGNVKSSTSAWALSGVRIGTTNVGGGVGNTTEGGFLYVRILKDTPGAGTARVSLYRAVGGGGGDQMATGDIAYPGSGSLAAANSSGLTATVTLGALAGGSETDDTHILRAQPDWPSRFLVIFDGSEAEHAVGLAAAQAAAAVMGQKFQEAQDAVASAITVWLQTRWKDFWISAFASPIGKSASNDGSGNITVAPTGLLEDGRLNMIDNTTVQYILQNVVTPSGATFDTRNQGLGAMATPTMEEYAVDGPLTLICFDQTVGGEKFTVTQATTRDHSVISAVFPLQIKKAFSDPNLGIRSMLLTRIFSLGGGGSVNDFKTITSWTLDGESPTNTADGSIYLQIVGSAGAWIINGYTAATLDATKQVFTTAATAEDGTATIIPVKSGSGLSGTVIVGHTPTTLHTGTWQLNTFRRQNTNGTSDRIEVPVAVTSRGQFERFIAQVFRYRLNSAASGSVTIDENYVKAGTFEAYSVDDA